jgi:hypothetical protein
VTEEVRERPYLLAALSIVAAAGLTAGILWWASESPESVLIGLAGFHDDASGERRAACLDCHVPFIGTPGSRCVSPGCHGQLATGSPPRDGPAMPIRFHVAVRDEPCGSCHVEHASRSELPDLRASFSHELVPLKVQDECRACHSGAKIANHSKTDAIDCRKCHFTTAWSGSRADHASVSGEHCDVCHVAPEGMPHENLAGTCSTCHGVDAWKPAMGAKN